MFRKMYATLIVLGITSLCTNVYSYTDSSENYFAVRLDLNVFKQLFKWIEDTDINLILEKLKPISWKGFSVTSLRVKTLEGERFNVSFHPETSSMIFNADIDKLVLTAGISNNILQATDLVMIDIKFSIELFVEYNNQVATFEDNDHCSLTYGHFSSENTWINSLIAYTRELIGNIGDAVCGRIGKDLTKQTFLLDSRMGIDLESGWGEKIYMHASEVIVGADYVYVVNQVFEVSTGSKKTVVAYSPGMSVPEVRTDRMVTMAISEGMLSIILKQHAMTVARQFNSVLRRYLTMRAMHNLFPVSKDVYPNASLQFDFTRQDFAMKINPMMMSIQINMTVRMLARTICKNGNVSRQIFTMDIDANIPVQMKYNDTHAWIHLKSIKGNISITNSSIGPANSDDFTFWVLHGPKLFYHDMFDKINKLVVPFQLKPLAKLPSSLVVKDTSITFLNGALLITENIEEVSGHVQTKVQPMKTYGQVYDIRDSGLYVTDHPSNNYTERMDYVACIDNSSRMMAPAIVSSVFLLSLSIINALHCVS